jgi:hypothetical protein
VGSLTEVNWIAPPRLEIAAEGTAEGNIAAEGNMDAPADWSLPQEKAAAPAAAAPQQRGIWPLTMKVNSNTSILSCNVPVYDSSKPVSGTKEARVRRHTNAASARVLHCFVLRAADVFD